MENINNPGISETFKPKGYKGNYDLNKFEFPHVTNKDGSVSNILTQYSSIQDDKGNTKYVLYPTMHKGKRISDPSAKSKDKNFGVYDSVEELQKADAIIHGYFEEQKSIEDDIMHWLHQLLSF